MIVNVQGTYRFSNRDNSNLEISVMVQIRNRCTHEACQLTNILDRVANIKICLGDAKYCAQSNALNSWIKARSSIV